MRALIFLFLPLTTLANDYRGIPEQPRAAALRRSAEDWVRREAQPLFVSYGIREIRSLGVEVREPRVILPPDLGGPNPRHPLVRVEVRVRFSGWRVERTEWESGWVECGFDQVLFAVTNAKGQPVRIQNGQRLRAPLACRGYGRPRRW
jgi:hypothetical protein